MKINTLLYFKVRCTFLVVIFSCFCFISFAQPYGNEWINYNQQYYKFPILTDGVYRINATSLPSSFASVDINKIQVFGRGEEQALYINDINGSGTLDAVGEYIEFYGRRNDGYLDSLVYDT